MNGRKLGELYLKFHNGDSLTDKELREYNKFCNEMLDFCSVTGNSMVSPRFAMDYQATGNQMFHRGMKD